MDTSGEPAHLDCVKSGRRDEPVNIFLDVCLCLIAINLAAKRNRVHAGTWRWRMPLSWAGVPSIMQHSEMPSAVEQSVVCLPSNAP